MNRIPESCFDPKVPTGVPIRYPHNCSGKSDRPLVVTRSTSGWKWRCHRCLNQGVRSIYNSSGRVILRFMESESTSSNTPIKIPLNTGRITKEATDLYIWLMSYGITQDEIDQYGIYFSDQLLVFPIYKDGEIIYWLARTHPSSKMPKWITPRGGNREDTFFYSDLTSGKRVILVEDIVSAIKVGRVYPSVGLLYAYTSDALVLRLSKQYPEIVLWLDFDKADYMMKMFSRYRAFGLNVDCRLTNKDPKGYTNSVIETIIERREPFGRFYYLPTGLSGKEHV